MNNMTISKKECAELFGVKVGSVGNYVYRGRILRTDDRPMRIVVDASLMACHMNKYRYTCSSLEEFCSKKLPELKQSTQAQSELKETTQQPPHGLVTALRAQAKGLKKDLSEAHQKINHQAQLLKIAANEVASYRDKAARILCENSTLNRIIEAKNAEIERLKNGAMLVASQGDTSINSLRSELESLRQENDQLRSESIVIEVDTAKNPVAVIPGVLHSDLEKQLDEKTAYISRMEALVKQQVKEFDNLAKKHEAAKRKISRLQDKLNPPLPMNASYETACAVLHEDKAGGAKKSHYASECEVSESSDVILDTPLFPAEDKVKFRIEAEKFDPSTIRKSANG